MVRRRHGWQLPAHTFQVVAITVFLLLGVAFYIFLAPFLWFRFLEIAALALYSPLAFAVFLLYIRSSAIDPADVGVFQPQSKNIEKVTVSEGSAGVTPGDGLRHPSPGLSTPSRSSSVRPFDKKLESKGTYTEESGVVQETQKIQIFLAALCGMFCGWVVKDDSCKDEFNLQRPLTEEDILFCTLCNAEVRKFSKHCRSCDKCVDGFDHHCRWLNNCVGRKNYNTFVSLMATSLSLLVLEWGLGMAVLVRCFVDKTGVDHQIVDKLGNGFSRGLFATIVAICTLVSLLASVPLGELFFFHLILIRKGITTYEYVVAMRVQNEHGFSAEGDVPSFPTSPSTSTGTGLSGSSSVGLQYSRGGWCTPPRVFVDHQDEVLPHLVAGQVPSTVDPDAGNVAGRYNNRQKKSAIRISAWKLAKLNTDDAVRAAAKARETSSTLRPLEHFELEVGEGDYTSSTNIYSTTSSISGDYSNRKERLKNNSRMAVDNVQYSSPYSTKGDRSVQHEPFEMEDQSISSDSSPSHTLNVPSSLNSVPAEYRDGLPFPPKGLRLATFPGDSMEAIPEGVTSDSFFRGDLTAHRSTALSSSSADFARAWSGPAAYSDGYEASSGESVDDGDFPSRNRLPSRERVSTDHIALSVEGRKVNLIRNRSSGAHEIVTSDGNRETSNARNNLPGFRSHWLAPSASPSSSSDRARSGYVLESSSPSQRSQLTDASSLQSSSLSLGNLVYSGTSIFYGGPMAQPPIMTKGERLAISPKSPIHLKPRATNPTLAPELKVPVRVALRSPSPVFAPRTILPFSLSGSPRD